jgi:Xaa-Pro aminopeptidase
VEELRCIKDSEEIARIEKAVAISDFAFNTIAPTIQPGKTELQVAWEIEKCLRENGSENLPFEIIVASGPKSALPHAHPSERVICDGDSVVIDMGARYGGYASDLSRTICAGTPSDLFKKIYTIVLDAQTAALRIISSGITGGDADAAAREVIQQAGHGEAFGHSLGHGVGLAAHEAPRLSPGVNDPLLDGMVFTIEPGIYLSGWGGVRIEDTGVLENGELRVLSRAEKARYD